MNRQFDFGRRARLVTLGDQALYSGTNFLLAISLAALAGMEALGHFALIISVSAFLHSVYVGVILEPLTVFASETKQKRLRTIYAHVAAVITLGALAFGGMLLWLGEAAGLAYVTDIALGFVVFGGQSTVLCGKRSLLMRGNVVGSALVSALYFAGAAAVAIYFYATDSFDEYGVVGAIVAASVLASGKWWLRSILRRCGLDEFRRAVGVVREYTLWTVLTSLPASVSLYGIYWIAEFAASRDVVGLLKLCEQLLTPFFQIAMTMSMLDQIESAREYESADHSQVALRLARRTKSYQLLAAGYVIVLVIAVFVYHWIGGQITAGFLPALLLYCVIPFLYAYSIPRNVAAKARRRPEFNALAYSGMALTVILVGVLWLPGQLAGLVAVLALGWCVNATILSFKVSGMLGEMKRAT